MRTTEMRESASTIRTQAGRRARSFRAPSVRALVPDVRALKILGVLLAVIVAALALAILLGGPRQLPPMASIDSPFRHVDFSRLPPRSRFTARDGRALAYRAYPASGSVRRGSVVLVHGSAAQSQSLHPLAMRLAEAGFDSYALDVRGHGESGTRGRIAYVGQLEDDLEDLVAAVGPAHPRLLLGFSSGGGFALRFAGSDRQRLFEGYVLLSPFLHQEAATYRPDAGGWVSVGVPRIAALTILDRIGIRWFADLPVAAYAIDARSRDILTPSYSFALAANFRPHQDWRGDVRRTSQPMIVLVGADDEVFRPDRFAEAFEKAGRAVPVTTVPGVGHVGLTLEPAGMAAIVNAVQRLTEGLH